MVINIKIMRNFILIQPVLFLLVPVLLLAEKGNTPEEVLDKLYRTNGNKIILKPSLRITHDQKNAAYFMRQSNVIEVSDKLLEVCRSFGSDSASALSFVFGHELSHAFQLDLKAQETSFLAYDKSNNSTNFHEEAADISGAFMSYMAGYRSLNMIEPLIDRIYETFKLKENLSGYPSLEERKLTAQRVRNMVLELIQIYEVGNYLTAAGRYDLATPCYEFVAKWYKGREVYNNLGINYAYLAMNFTALNLDEYVYPFEINWDTRMKKPTLNRGENVSKEEVLLREEYLNKSRENFVMASRLDPMFISSEIHLMCLLMLQGKAEQAMEHYEKSKLGKLNYKIYQDDENKDKLRLALAICYIKVNQKEKAQRLLEEIVQSSNKVLAAQARLNLDILNGKNKPNFKALGCKSFPPAQKLIDNVRIHRIQESDRWILLDDKQALYLSIHELKNSVLYSFKTNKYYFNLQKVYGNGNVFKFKIPDYSTATLSSAGSVYHCDQGHYLLKLDPKNTIVEWIKYE